MIIKIASALITFMPSTMKDIKLKTTQLQSLRYIVHYCGYMNQREIREHTVCMIVSMMSNEAAITDAIVHGEFK